MMWNTEDIRWKPNQMTKNAAAITVDSETEGGKTETPNERDDSEQSGTETVERIEDSTPEEWDLPENTEYTEFLLGPTFWERRP